MDEAKFKQFLDELNSDDGPAGDFTETESFIDKCASLSPSESDDLKAQQSVSSSLDGNFEEDLTETKILKRKIGLLEQKCRRFDAHNEVLTKELYQEKIKLSKMRAKLQFIKENQDVFVQLKEAYVNMKYNQTTGKQLAEVKESGAQTYEGILCRACIKTEQLRRSLDHFTSQYENGTFLTKDDTERLAKTTFYIREMLVKHDKHYAGVMKRQNDYKEYITYLEDENETLKDIIRGHKSIENSSSCTNTDSDFTKKEVHILKKIVIKLYKRYKEALRLGNVDEKAVKTMEMDKKELKLVEQLALKFAQKSVKKMPLKTCLGDGLDQVDNHTDKEVEQ